MSRPRKISCCFCPSVSGPSRSDMPYSVTIWRATLVARSMSLAAPVVMSPTTSSSATRPPRSIDSSSNSSSRVARNLSCSGRGSVYPSAGPRGEQRRLVDHVREVGAGEAGRALGDRVQVHLGRERLAVCVDVQDALAALEVWAVHHYVPVEPAGTKQAPAQGNRAGR